MLKLRELEKKYLEMASTEVWTYNDLHWLYFGDKPSPSLETLLEIKTYYLMQALLPGDTTEQRQFFLAHHHIEDNPIEVTVIKADVLRDLLSRLTLLQELHQDKTLVHRDDVKSVMEQWQYNWPSAYKSIYWVVGNLLVTLKHATLDEIVTYGKETIFSLSQQETGAVHQISKRRELEKKVVEIGQSQVWTRKNLRWLHQDKAQDFAAYLQAAMDLQAYYAEQIESPDLSNDTTAISADVLHDYLSRLELLRTLRRDQKLSDRASIKAMMKKWQPTFTSIYEVIDDKLVPLEQALNSIIESGCQRIACLENDRN